MITITNESEQDGESKANDIIFCITDQINQGITGVDALELRLDCAKLNKIAGAKAMTLSDYATAHSYLKNTLDLLPAYHWQCHYELSLRAHFLLAKSAHSCGLIDESSSVLQIILQNARSLSDKLDSYLLLVVILTDKYALEEAYQTAHNVLLQLGESIPTAFSKDDITASIRATSQLIHGVTEERLLERQEMESQDKQFVLQFYNHISLVAFFAVPQMVPFFICRMIQVSMTHGICKFSLLGELKISSAASGYIISDYHTLFFRRLFMWSTGFVQYANM